MSWQKWYKIFFEEAKNQIKESPDISPVHGTDHLLRVWKMSRNLCERLKGDIEITAASVMLHDLGRHHGLEIHGKKSAELAKPILEKHAFPKDKIPKVLGAIAQHDYNFPAGKRKLVEAKILYDADKIDSFGVMGVYRHILFVRAGRIKMSDVLPLLEKRWKGLNLKESRNMARKEYEYAVNFFKTLQKELDEEG